MSHLLENDYLAVATDLEEALRWRRQHPGARVIAGGTEVLADQALELFHPNGYLHVGRVEALQSIDRLLLLVPSWFLSRILEATERSPRPCAID